MTDGRGEQELVLFCQQHKKEFLNSFSVFHIYTFFLLFIPQKQHVKKAYYLKSRAKIQIKFPLLKGQQMF